MTNYARENRMRRVQDELRINGPYYFVIDKIFDAIIFIALIGTFFRRGRKSLKYAAIWFSAGFIRDVILNVLHQIDCRKNSGMPL